MITANEWDAWHHESNVVDLDKQRKRQRRLKAEMEVSRLGEELAAMNRKVAALQAENNKLFRAWQDARKPIEITREKEQSNFTDGVLMGAIGAASVSLLLFLFM